MRLLTIVLFLLAIQIETSYAQGKLLFCSRHDKSGFPLDTLQFANIPAEGIKIFIFYRPLSGKIETTELILEKEFHAGSGPVTVDKQKYFTGPGKDFFIVEQEVKNPGEYIFRIMNYDGELLAENILPAFGIKQNKERGRNEGKVIQPEEVNSEPQLKIFCSEEINSSECIFRDCRGFLKLKLINTFPGNYTIDLWQKRSGQYDVFIGSYTVEFQSTSEWPEAGFKINAPGEYKLNVFSTENLLLSTSEVMLK